MILLPDDRSRASCRQTGLHHRAACHDPRRWEVWRRPDYPICAIARTAEAKALGIKMGDAYHLNQKDWARWRVQIFSSNYTLYGDLSARVMRTPADFPPELEAYSIDKAFLGLSGFADLEGHARSLRTAVGRMGIPVCCGVSITETLAKVANRTAKKDPARGGVAVLMDEASQTAGLATMDLGDV